MVLLFVIDIFSKYVWVVPLKVKKGVTIVNVFQNILDSSKKKKKLNKTWVDQGSEIYNSLFKNDNDIKICLTYNERKSVVAEDLLEH